MSPRSEEFMAMARERLAAAQRELGAGSASSAVSLAYYATLYAARAALSEDERNAKTHAGTWHLFRDRFVSTGRFDRGVAGEAERVQHLRERADYDAYAVPPEQAEEVVAVAERFVAAIDELFAT